MASRPAPRPKSKSGGSRPAAQHSVSAQRSYRRVIAQVQKWNKH